MAKVRQILAVVGVGAVTTACSLNPFGEDPTFQEEDSAKSDTPSGNGEPGSGFLPDFGNPSATAVTPPSSPGPEEVDEPSNAGSMAGPSAGATGPAGPDGITPGAAPTPSPGFDPGLDDGAHDEPGGADAGAVFDGTFTDAGVVPPVGDGGPSGSADGGD